MNYPHHAQERAANLSMNPAPLRSASDCRGVGPAESLGRYDRGILGGIPSAMCCGADVGRRLRPGSSAGRATVLAWNSLPWYCVSMKLAQSRVTAQGQISVPAEVRKRLELVPGSILEWDAEGDRITVRRVGRHSFEDLHRALFSGEPQPRSLEDLKEGIRQRMRARHARR
jgi:antitoxin PrlF